MRKRRLTREAVGGAGLQAMCLSKGGLGLGERLVWVEAKNWAENLLGKRGSSPAVLRPLESYVGSGDFISHQLHQQEQGFRSPQRGLASLALYS